MFFNRKGFTLIEVMVSILILLVGLLALLQATNYALYHDLNNQLRNEAVTYGDEVMTRELAKPFASISTGGRWQNGVQESSQRQVSLASTNFTATRINQQVTPNTTSVQVTVRWTYKGQNYSHSLSSLTGR